MVDKEKLLELAKRSASTGLTDFAVRVSVELFSENEKLRKYPELKEAISDGLASSLTGAVANIFKETK